LDEPDGMSVFGLVTVNKKEIEATKVMLT